MEDFHNYDRVLVDAAVTGTGENIEGVVSDVSQFLGETFVSVIYDHPDSTGRKGITVSNPRLLRKLINKK